MVYLLRFTISRHSLGVTYINVYQNLIAEGQAAHARLDAQDVVVHREQLLDLSGIGVGRAATRGLEPHLHLCVVDAGEVAGTGWLVLLWVQSEAVAVDTWVGVAGVVVPWLHLVEVLAVLLLEAVLAVQDQLELVQWADLQVGACSTILH